MEEAVEWVKRIPFDPETSPDNSEIEIRQVFEMEDFGAEFTPEAREQDDRLRLTVAIRGLADETVVALRVCRRHLLDHLGRVDDVADRRLTARFPAADH